MNIRRTLSKQRPPAILDVRNEECLKEFLAGAVFYPASRLDPRPVMALAGRFSDFVYVDYSLGAKRVERTLCGPRFDGYRIAAIEDLAPELVLGCSWDDLPPPTRLDPVRMKKPFIKIACFKKQPNAAGSGAEQIRILYICGEGHAIYEALYRHRDLAPACLAYINPGIHEGGNYPDFPGILAHRLLVDIEWWLPKYLLHDFSGMDERAEDFFAIHPLYEPEEESGTQGDDVSPSRLALYRRKNHLDPMEVSIARCDAVSRVRMRGFFERREKERRARKKRGNQASGQGKNLCGTTANLNSE